MFAFPYTIDLNSDLFKLRKEEHDVRVLNRGSGTVAINSRAESAEHVEGRVKALKLSIEHDQARLVEEIIKLYLLKLQDATDRALKAKKDECSKQYVAMKSQEHQFKNQAKKANLRKRAISLGLDSFEDSDRSDSDGNQQRQRTDSEAKSPALNQSQFSNGQGFNASDPFYSQSSYYMPNMYGYYQPFAYPYASSSASTSLPVSHPPTLPIMTHPAPSLGDIEFKSSSSSEAPIARPKTPARPSSSRPNIRINTTTSPTGDLSSRLGAVILENTDSQASVPSHGRVRSQGPEIVAHTTSAPSRK